jgi:alkylation response protein AidB-like acyl-CoA dehydrogenase
MGLIDGGVGPMFGAARTPPMAITNTADLLAVVDRVATEVIAKHAAEVDASARFPRESIDALRNEGVLGLVSATEVGGSAQGPSVVSTVIERIARECGSTAMVVCMHYCGAAVLEKYASPDTRKQAASGEHLSTLAFSEAGSRSHFWAPTSTAVAEGGGFRLDASKSWVTSAHEATAYVWSSKPVSAEGASTLWLVPRNAPGLKVVGRFEGLGLRGNDSSPVCAAGVHVDASARLGADGSGFGTMMEVVLPLFSLLTASCSLGLMESAVARTCTHASGTQFEHLGSALRDLPTVRNYIARMRIETDMVATLIADATAAMSCGRPDTMLRVLEIKAAAGESSTRVLDLAMRVCGGAAFRKDVGVERQFRDARAAGVMAPTTDVLYDFIGKAVTGMDLF